MHNNSIWWPHRRPRNRPTPVSQSVSRTHVNIGKAGARQKKGEVAVAAVAAICCCNVLLFYTSLIARLCSAAAAVAAETFPVAILPLFKAVVKKAARASFSSNLQLVGQNSFLASSCVRGRLFFRDTGMGFLDTFWTPCLSH